MTETTTTNGAIEPAVEYRGGAMAVGRATGGLIPSDFEGMYRMSRIMAASGMMPKGIDRPEKVFVALQMGAEIGLSPMAAVQNIAVINGRPSIWGDAALAVVRASGLLAKFSERFLRDDAGNVTGAYCYAKRRDCGDEAETEFTLADAQKAGLLTKDGPWKQYPARMLKMRARSWTLRDLFPDVLRGVNIREEIEDIPASHVESEVVSTRPVTAADALREKLHAAARPVECEFEPVEDGPPDLDDEPAELQHATVEGEPDTDNVVGDFETMFAASIFSGRSQAWSERYGRLVKDACEAFEAAGSDDPRASTHHLIVTLLGSFGYETIDALPAGDRAKFLEAALEQLNQI